MRYSFPNAFLENTVTRKTRQMFPTFKFTDPQLDGALTNSTLITTNDRIASWLFIHAYFVRNGCILVELCDFKFSRCFCPVLRLTFTKTSISIYLILRVPTL